MTTRQLALELHELWERAQSLHFSARELLDRAPAQDPYRRLALEMAIQDLLSFATRAAALATFAEAVQRKRRSP